MVDPGHLDHVRPKVVSPGVELLGRVERYFGLVESSSNWSREGVLRVQVDRDEVLVHVEDCIVVALLLGIGRPFSVANHPVFVATKKKGLEFVDSPKSGCVGRHPLVHHQIGEVLHSPPLQIEPFIVLEEFLLQIELVL